MRQIIWCIYGHEKFALPPFNFITNIVSYFRYFIFDCPGQVELYTHHQSLRNVIEWLTSKVIDIRVTAVHLVDSHYCSDASKFVSVLLTSLATMLHMNLPHVNVLSKMDIAEQYGKWVKHLPALLWSGIFMGWGNRFYITRVHAVTLELLIPINRHSVHFYRLSRNDILKWLHNNRSLLCIKIDTMFTRAVKLAGSVGWLATSLSRLIGSAGWFGLADQPADTV